MALTPQDVQNKLFSSVRFKAGYDEDEVDSFLDEVEAELRRLHAEMERLQSALDDAVSVASVPQAAEKSPEPEAVFTPPATPDPATSVDPSASQVPQPISTPPPVQTPQFAIEPSPTEEALRRTLILAQRTADAVIAEARAEATALVTDSREQAEVTERTAAAEFAARQRERQAEQEELLAAVEELRSFEREYRSRLRAYLHLQLRDLDTSVPAEPGSLRAQVNREAIAGGSVAAAADEATEWDPHADAEEAVDISENTRESYVGSAPGGAGGWPDGDDDDD
jgi:DivIVA domain-containing protein